jgi:hypothetical protein
MSPKAPLAATRAALSGRHSISLAEGSKTSAAHTFGELRRLTRWRGTLIKKELLGVASLRNCGHNRNSRDMEVSRGHSLPRFDCEIANRDLLTFTNSQPRPEG